MKFEPLSKRADDPDAKKRRDVNIGLANNATGAAFGAVATAQAAYGAKKLIQNKQIKNPKVARFVARHPKLARAKWVVPAAAVLNVAGQAANAGLDAQSGAYFARERKNLSHKPVAKADNGIGTFYQRVRDRSYPSWEDPNARRQRELGVATGAGAALGVQGAARTVRAVRGLELSYPTRDANGRALKGKEIRVKPMAEIKNALTKNPRNRRGLAMAGVGLPLAALSYKLSHGPNERPWQ